MDILQEFSRALGHLAAEGSELEKSEACLKMQVFIDRRGVLLGKEKQVEALIRAVDTRDWQVVREIEENSCYEDLRLQARRALIATFGEREWES